MQWINKYEHGQRIITRLIKLCSRLPHESIEGIVSRNGKNQNQTKKNKKQKKN